MEYLNALRNNYRIQEYEFVRVLGAGGFGITYLAYDHNLDKPVAIKEYLPNDLAVRIDGTTVKPKATHDKENYEWGLDSFLKEARALARFDHRNLIKVHRFFEAHGTAYIVMEYAEGETLSKLLERQGALSEVQLKALLLPILDGLEQVHQADYLHRDIKPGNIVIRDEDQSPVLIDFGAARQAVGIKSKGVTSIVTHGYSPIEQYSTKGKLGPWVDIYALGAVSYHAITGLELEAATERVFKDELEEAVVAGKGKASEAFLTGIDAALKVNLEERPQTIPEWRQLLGATAPRQPAAQTSSTPEVNSGSKIPVLAMGVAALLLVVGVVIGYTLQEETSQALAIRELPVPPAVTEPPSVSAEPGKAAAISPPVRRVEGRESHPAVTPTETEIQRLMAEAETYRQTGSLSKAKKSYESVLLLEPKKTEAMAGLGWVEQQQADHAAAEQAQRLVIESPGAVTARDNAIKALLEGARADIVARRLLSPEGRNAYEKIQELLVLNPNSSEAENLLEEILSVYKGALKQALLRNEMVKAEGDLVRMKQVNPDAVAVSEAESLIAESRLSQQYALAGEMVDIPAGSFRMGHDHTSSEPAHTVSIKAFRMATHEVTFDKWDACVTDGGCKSYSPDDKGWGRNNRPVINVSWEDVQSFIGWLNQMTNGGYRLPSEAEWEYACRSGGKAETYCGGDTAGALAWYRENSEAKTHPVGQKRPNGLGLYDMSGNVYEWIQDCWNKDYRGAPNNGSAWTSGWCTDRVRRGGSWNIVSGYIDSNERSLFNFTSRDDDIGFRLAQDL